MRDWVDDVTGRERCFVAIPPDNVWSVSSIENKYGSRNTGFIVTTDSSLQVPGRRAPDPNLSVKIYRPEALFSG